MLVALAACIAFPAVMAENVDPGNTGAQYAWSENAGWLNAEPSGDGGPGLQVSDFDVAGWMWGENVGWISMSCQNTGSCVASDYGVANDGQGNLSGFAWGENVGWIRFAYDGGGVQIDPNTGAFGGWAWSENLGWISFSCSNTGSCGTSQFGIVTDWCQSTAAVPAGATDLRLDRSGDDVELMQLTLGGGAAWHEVVRGSLSVLRASGGDFAAATLECAGDNLVTPTAVVSGTPEPMPGDGYWYLARRVNCKGKGTYDTGAASQSGSRDAEIAAAAIDCP